VREDLAAEEGWGAKGTCMLVQIVGRAWAVEDRGLNSAVGADGEHSGRAGYLAPRRGCDRAAVAGDGQPWVLGGLVPALV